jgi:cytochrome c-type biogenesis protein CcmH
MGWLFVLLFSAATLGFLWWTKRLSRLALELSAAAILIGIAGYAWQGSPSMPGTPVVHPAQP